MRKRARTTVLTSQTGCPEKNILGLSATHTIPRNALKEVTVEKAFSFKVELGHHHQVALSYFTDVIQVASQRLLAQLWPEDWIATLVTTTKNSAYKVIDEARVCLTTAGMILGRVPELLAYKCA